MPRPRKNGPQFDWPAIYADWSKGEFTNRELSRKYGVSSVSIGRKAKDDGWTTTRGPVPDPVLIEDDEPEIVPEPKGKPGKTKTPTVAQMLKQSKDIVKRLIAEVDNVTTYQDEIRDIIIIEETDVLKRRAALRAISVNERTKTMKDLVATLRMIEPGKGGRPRKDADETVDEPKGKKAQRQAEAEKAAANGAFAVPAPPPRLVSSKP